MILIFAVLLIVSLFSLKLTNRLNIPFLLVFLGIGILFGSDALNIVYFDDMLLTRQIADIALIFVIFEAGFKLKRESVKVVMAPSLILATAGVVATALLIGLFVHFVFRLELRYSFLIGSIISSTDASAVVHLLRNNPVRPRIGDTLEFESASNDPAAIILTVFFIGLVGNGEAGGIGMLILKLLYRLAGGIAAGLGCGFVGVRLFKRLKPESRGYYYILLIGICLFAYGFADLIRANGIISVFFCGILMGNTRFAYKKGVESFLEGISTFANTTLFLLLGLLVFPGRFPSILGVSTAIAAFVILVARPIVVVPVAALFRYAPKEIVFLCFAGIKGAVPIVLSTYPAAYGLDDNHEIFNIVFVIVLISLVVQGIGMRPVARLLGLNVPAKKLSGHSVELLSTDESSLDIFEFNVDDDARFVGKRLSELDLPENVSITSIVRNGKILVPRGGTELIRNDILYVLASDEQFAKLSG